MFEVSPTLATKTFLEVTSRKPDEPTRERVQPVVNSRRRYTKRTHVVADHDLVLEPVSYITRGPDSRGVRRPHEFVGDVTTIHVQPEREIAFDAARAGQRSNSAAQSQIFIEGVLQIAGEYDLCALSLIRVGSPGVEEVAHLWIQYPAQELDLKLQQLHVLAALNIFCISRCVGVGRVETELVQITDVAIDADVHVAVFGIRYLESEVWRVATIELIFVVLSRRFRLNWRRRLCVRRLLRRRGCNWLS